MPITSPTLEELLSSESVNVDCPDYPNCEHCEKGICIRIIAVANLPSRFGKFKIIGFINNKDRRDDHAAIVKGDISGKENVLCRIHSECLTGDALGSLRCDCRDQLKTALKQDLRQYSVIIPMVIDQDEMLIWHWRLAIC